MNEKEAVDIYIVDGVEGGALVINDKRVAGPKPWGGGKIIKTWITTVEDILIAIATNQKENKKIYKFWYNGEFKVTIERKIKP